MISCETMASRVIQIQLLQFATLISIFALTALVLLVDPILPQGGDKIRPPLLFFLHHPKTAQGIKLKLSDFKDTLLRHILQFKLVR